MPANRISKGIRRKARRKSKAADTQVGGFESPQPQRDSVLQLQSTIGNQATQALLSPNEHRLQRKPFSGIPPVGSLSRAKHRHPDLQSETSTHVIQRFVSSEHKSLGDITGDMVPAGALFEGSPELSYGEIVALSGDFYRSYENLASPYYILKGNSEDRSDPDASRQKKIDEINALKNLFNVETSIRAAGQEPEGLDTGYVEFNGESLPGFENVTGGRYLNLAKENFPHFTVSDHNNIESWMAGHTTALEEAFQAGLVNDQAKLTLALARNAASNHFLTDAFSSGHMRVPRSDADRYYRKLMEATAQSMADALINELPEKVGVDIDLTDFAPPGVRGMLRTIPNIERYTKYGISFDIREPVRSKAAPYIEKFKKAMHDQVGPAVGGLVSKWLHDKDNEQGLLVTNKAGGKWMAYGDAFLDKAAPTGVDVNTTNRQEAEKAVHADRDEVVAMFEKGQQKQETTDSGDHGGSTSPIPDAVYFNFDKPKSPNDITSINDPGLTQLESLAQYLKTTPGVKVNLQGWADSRGDEDYNRQLAGRRISAVQAYLQGAGVPPSRMGMATPEGEPLVATTSGNHHQFRRVDIKIEQTNETFEAEQISDDDKPEMELPTPYAAQQFLPEVDPSNPPLDPYKWCEIEDEALKGEFFKVVHKSGKEFLEGMATELVHENIPETYDIDVTIPVPFTDDIHIQESIPVRDWVMGKARPLVDKAVDAVVTEDRVVGLMDGACSVADMGEEAAAP
jgi:outer membrane protein OmpA-like peptidoglycan-associated protein